MADGVSAQDRTREAEHEDLQAHVAAMLNQRFDNLIKPDQEYWEEWRRGAEPSTFDLYARFEVEPASTQPATMPDQDRAAAGPDADALLPSLAWVHGRINGTVVLEIKKALWRKRPACRSAT